MRVSEAKGVNVLDELVEPGGEQSAEERSAASNSVSVGDYRGERESDEHPVDPVISVEAPQNYRRTEAARRLCVHAGE